jgi:1,4-alpha-glucan branching enzyme
MADIDANLWAQLQLIAAGAHHDPHAVLGVHTNGAQARFITHQPNTSSVCLTDGRPLERLTASDFFIWSGDAASVPSRISIHCTDSHGHSHERVDAYSFASHIDTRELASFNAGSHNAIWRLLGALPQTHDGIAGTRFAVWAPNAARVSVVGPFCNWDGRCFPMRALGSSGVWEIFLPGIQSGEVYKFEVRNRRTGAVALKSDPVARAAELRPDTASLVTSSAYAWRDQTWLDDRSRHDWLHAPMSIYEVHPGSWRRHGDARVYSYGDLTRELLPYVREMGFTHIELMPITEHPLDDSWGYQTTGYFAPTSRFGTPDELRHFVDECHLAHIGVLLDWVPGHFPRDAHGLANFDGEALYEYHDPRQAEHKDWGTLIFNYERHEVRSFLISSACYWLEEFHFDGLRVDAVASMLYLDFGRGQDYVRNKHGGRHNLEAIDFLRALNAVTHTNYPGTVVIAEESTDWPQVSRPVDGGGLGFSMKWNMGWMHDTLDYFKQDPIYRAHHHNKLTFGMMYAFSENFVLPFSHDEVVHLKRSLLGRMPGDHWQQYANLRLLYTYMWTFPGKKLLFMGGDLATPWEWDFRTQLPWWLLEREEHRGVQRALADLNRVYVNEPALHRRDFEAGGFEWLDCDDSARSVLCFRRRAGHASAGDSSNAAHDVVVALNFTPVPRHDYRIGVAHLGDYAELYNSDSQHYGGSNLGNSSAVRALPEPHQGQPCSLQITLPPLAAVILKAV